MTFNQFDGDETTTPVAPVAQPVETPVVEETAAPAEETPATEETTQA